MKCPTNIQLPDLYFTSVFFALIAFLGHPVKDVDFHLSISLSTSSHVLGTSQVGDRCGFKCHLVGFLSGFMQATLAAGFPLSTLPCS